MNFLDYARENFKDNKKIIAFMDESGKLYDLRDEYIEGTKPVYIGEEKALEIIRHSTAHLMAQAVKRLFKDVKVAIGPVIENGFYYDFDIEGTFSTEDLKKIEEEMKKIVKENIPIEKFWLSKEEAIKFFEEKGEIYKVEIISELDEEKVSLYKQGEFVDLCRGPHVLSTGQLKFFKLISSSGAYWRGDESNKMLQRIYGTAFEDKKKLKEYLKFLEEVKKRDHRNLNKDLKIFLTSPLIGGGFIIWQPNGAVLRGLIEDLERKEHIKRGYQPVISPHIMRSDMWKTSGHYDYYKENMYFTKIENVEYGIKPMNCPAHIMVYKSDVRSWRDLPLRLFEFGTVYRYERSGTLHGLMRVRGFTQDDAHIFCMPEQMEEEIKGVIDFIFYFLKPFGFDLEITLSTRPDKFIGEKELWDKAEDILRKALKEKNIDYIIDEGGGAFYGPKIDFKLKDAIGRKWQGPTIQLDFNLPNRFDLEYTDKDGNKKRPVMIHRTILGSMERFIGVLIEHFAGWFPAWLAPVQVKILPVKDEIIEYANKVKEKLVDAGIRVKIDSSDNTLSYRLRRASKERIPITMILGEKEKEEGKVSIRLKGNEQKNMIHLDEVIKMCSVPF